MFMGLGQVLNETQESQIILSTLRERLWCSADQRTGGNLEKEFIHVLSFEPIQCATQLQCGGCSLQNDATFSQDMAQEIHHRHASHLLNYSYW